MFTKKTNLRDEYESILSDMLFMQYRVEVLRRKMQVAGSNDEKFGRNLQLSVDESVSELVKLGNCNELASEVSKPWWTK